MGRILRAAVVVLLAVAGCGDDGEAGGETEVTLKRTPRPSAEQAAQLEVDIAAIYPGIPEGKATDWSVSTCSDMLAGELDDGALVDRAVQRFAGGDRPDPTPDQAQQIIDAIHDSGFCVET